MSVDVFSFSCASLAKAKLVGFKGTEHISRPYVFEIFFTVPSGTDVRAAVGDKATLTAARGDDREPMRWHGVFAKLRLLRHVDERVLYCGTLVPRLWRLRHCLRSNVATKQNIKEFLTDTLKHGGLSEGDFRFHIDESSYPKEEFVAQYRESHLEFFHRWLEREGLYYFFEHEEDENGKEILVIVDDMGQHDAFGSSEPLRYFPSGAGDASAGEGLHVFQCDYQALPADVLITDYNYANPSAPVEGDHAVSKNGMGQIRDYGYRVFDESEAKRLAAIKAQSLACREMVVRTGGNVMRLRAGYTFEISDLGAEELPTEYLPFEVRHAGSLAGATADMSAMTGLQSEVTYHVEVQAVPKDVQYRAPQTSPWPRIYGFENAVVDGPAESIYAQIDDQGRYLVKFYFDASDLTDGVASTYIRMAQPHGGASEGQHFPLRKGTEVMVAFQGGDPDRPLISGVVPNATHPSTVTANNHTHNV
ncbi:MAG: type VI secretion system tip protein VgrG, partial [Deltaproteobacteria bacterium]|nr:type VI secretion system tip protein VgrG [Deltaproteobacteria bacterium]